jgi:uncharacterized membrane protein (UPF0136 family)
MKKRSKNVILSGIFFGVFMGIFATFRYGISWIALVQGVLCGILFGVFMYLFSNSKKIKQQTQVEITEDDVLIYSGDANHNVKLEGVGGKLYLFSNKLQFQSHKLNIQSHGLIIEITQIEKVAIYNTLGLIPNGLVITTTEGKTEKFVVNDRKVWKAEIEKLLTNK